MLNDNLTVFLAPSEHKHYGHTVLVLSKLKKINATAPQPQRNVLKYFAIFKNVALGISPGSKLCTMFLNLTKNDEIM